MLEAAARIQKWREDPVAFVQDNFGVTPDEWQKEALEAFGNKNLPKARIALRACVGPGKTAVLAWCIWNFLSCQGEPGHHPKAAAVSVTSDNLKDNLWPELSHWQKRSPFLQQAFTWTKERIFSNDHPETWFVSARTWSKTATAEDQGKTLSGLHSRYVLAVIDESGEIPVAVLRAAEQSLAERDCKFGRIIQAGNPSSLDGMLYAAATALASDWTNIRVTGDPNDPRRSPRIDAAWAESQISKYGRSDPWIKYSILGEFPERSITSLLGVEEVEAAMQRTLTMRDIVYASKRIGVDVARFGDDRTVLFPRQGRQAFYPKILRNARNTEIASIVIAAKLKFESSSETIDGTGGYGGGVIDCLVAAGYTPTEANSNHTPDDPRYFNKRSEMYFRLSEWIRRGGSLPKMPALARELTSPTYTFTNGKFRVEEKDQIKRRLKSSPDLADALALTFYHAEHFNPSLYDTDTTSKMPDYDPLNNP